MSGKYKIGLVMLTCVASGVFASEALHSQTKAPVYLIGQIDVSDPDGYAREYLPKAREIIKAHGGDYNQAALAEGHALNALVAKMQDDYRVIHNSGYESIEGITAGTKRFVQFDVDLDAGVPKAEATTDTPASTLVLKSDTGKVLVDRNGNLFHYVMEPTLWGTKAQFMAPLSAEAAAKAEMKALPRAEAPPRA